MRFHGRFALPLATLLLSACAATAFASGPDHWVGSWGAAPDAARNSKDFLASDTTVRDVVHLSLGGSQIRIIVSNEFGTEPLVLGGASAALSAGADAIKPGTSHAVMFGGHPGITIPVGALVVSDPIPLSVAPLSDVAVSLFFPAQTISTITQHPLSETTNYAASGNELDAASLTSPEKVTPWRFLKGIDVLGDKDAAAIVAFGDSITDGYGSTSGANNRWPNVLAQQLQANKKYAHLGVLDEGISGNRILHDKAGPNALSRFDRDVLAQDGVKYLIILEGINDIGHTAFPINPDDHEQITADELITALEQMIDRAHAHGIKVIGATLTPYQGAKYYADSGEAIRQAVNKFIRTSGKFDGVVDFDKLTSDPQHPQMFLPADEHGDHLHPNDTGYDVMGKGIDLKLFAK